jgi:aryl carrier-like protein
MIEALILRGWKEISAACGLRSIKVMKKKAKKYKMPFLRLDGRVEIARITLIEWHKSLSRAVESNKNSEMGATIPDNFSKKV